MRQLAIAYLNAGLMSNGLKLGLLRFVLTANARIRIAKLIWGGNMTGLNYIMLQR
jgi:hypothetical protein